MQTDIYQWLRSVALKAETERFVYAAQYQRIFTKTFQSNILHNKVDSRCKFCKTSTETTNHLISGCTILAPTILLDNIYTGKSVTILILKHPKNAITIKRYLLWLPQKGTILWDFPIRTERAIQAKKPDIVIKHIQNKQFQLIDMSVPSNTNISAKDF